MSDLAAADAIDGIAIIGLSGRFPGAHNLEAFWQNLSAGVESVSFFSDEEVLASGLDPARLNDPDFVKARAIIEDAGLFDAAFFGYSPSEAEIIDPQQRLFLECAWEVLERAGYDSERYDGAIGVYGGVSLNTYLLANLYLNRDLIASVGEFQTLISNDKDYATTRISYKLNLKGPSIAVQTACSTALVAICMACDSLLHYQCDLALAGGASVGVPQRAGYIYQEGGIGSPDGHCRAFDAAGHGTVGGDGVGVVLLKRLEEALADGDTIHAVISGFAINNDGALKVGYTAPSVEGQLEVIAAALSMAGVDPATIGYVEAHGTATRLGDPIEIAALTQAFRATTDQTGFCAIGSVKTNIGHLNAAAGIAGLIKTVLALEHGQIPPSLHFYAPNPAIDFADSPFYVNTALSPWPERDSPRRAGVSSFGIGGTNAHVVLEEAPALAPSGPSRRWQLLLLSARSSAARDHATANLLDYLEQQREVDLADVAYTLQIGRRGFEHRRMLVCQDVDDALRAFGQSQRPLTAVQAAQAPPIVFLFPGDGAQFAQMGAELYRDEPIFREHVDHCAELLKPQLGVDLREIMYVQGSEIRDQGSGSECGTDWQARPRTGGSRTAPTTDPRPLALDQRQYAQPALFVVEYALARLWMAWGVQPQAMLGHSLGEYVAACLAGVFSLEDALALVAVRARLMAKMPRGAMLSVPLAADAVRPLLGKHLALAAINGPAQCVVSGPTEAIDEFEYTLAAQGLELRRMQIDMAAHSELVTPIVETFAAFVGTLRLHAPRIPYISNVSGTWITPTEATDPRYWSRQLRQTVRFADGLAVLLDDPSRILLEVGPGQTLTALARLQGDHAPTVLASMRHPDDQQSEAAFLLTTLGQLWLAGVRVDWASFSAHERRHRIRLPTYPFERQRYWIEPQAAAAPLGARRPDTADWLYLPSWKRTIPPRAITAAESRRWLIWLDACGIGDQFAQALRQQGHLVTTVALGESFARLADHAYRLNPARRDEYDALLHDLQAEQRLPERIAHLWSITPAAQPSADADEAASAQDHGFHSLIFLAQALAQQPIGPLQVMVLSSALHEVNGEVIVRPQHAPLLAACRVISQEYPSVACRSVDLLLPASGTPAEQRQISQLVAELSAPADGLIVAYREQHRWAQSFEPVRLAATEPAAGLRAGGVYLIIGGLSEIGLALAAHLARAAQAKLALVERATLPARAEWDVWLATHTDDDAASRAIRGVRALERLGADVLVCSADVAEQAQMRAAFDLVRERFGALHGVVYAAGSDEDQPVRTLHDFSRDESAQHFRAKAHGLFVLEALLRGHALDWCILCSSLAALLGGATYDDAAANLFMDAFVRRHNQLDPVPWLSLSWEIQRHSDANTSSELALTPDEAVAIFRRVLALGPVAQVVVSTSATFSE